MWNRNDNRQQPGGPDSPNVDFNTSNDNPFDSGNRFANMLLGNYTSISQSNGVYYSDYRFYGYEAYGQDSWRMSKNFTLEFGAALGVSRTHVYARQVPGAVLRSGSLRSGEGRADRHHVDGPAARQHRAGHAAIRSTASSKKISREYRRASPSIA